MGELILKWWPVIGVAVCWMLRELLRYFRKLRDDHQILEKRVTTQEYAHKSHEDLCGERWLASRVEAKHLVDMTNERHQENVARFDRLEEKFDDMVTWVKGR